MPPAGGGSSNGEYWGQTPFLRDVLVKRDVLKLNKPLKPHQNKPKQTKTNQNKPQVVQSEIRRNRSRSFANSSSAGLVPDLVLNRIIGTGGYGTVYKGAARFSACLLACLLLVVMQCSACLLRRLGGCCGGRSSCCVRRWWCIDSYAQPRSPPLTAPPPRPQPTEPRQAPGRK